MTSSKYPSSNQANPKGWKIAQSLHTLIRQFNPSDWFMLMVIGGLLIITAHSLYLSGWQIDLPVIASISAISILVSYALACSRYDELFALISTCLYGILSTLLVVSFSQSRQLQAGLNATLTHVALWIVNIFNGQFEPDPVILTLLASILFWFMGYNLTWHLFRLGQSFRAVLSPAIILLANLIYSTQPYRLLPNMMIFCYLSLLMVTRSTVDYKEWDWYQRRMSVSIPQILRLQMSLVGSIIAMVALLLAWSVPTSLLDERLETLQQTLRDDPLTRLAETWNRLFTDLQTYGQVTTDYYGADSLTLSGAIQLGDQVVMEVEAPLGRRYYWRSRVFDTYQNGSWSSQANIRLQDSQPPFEVNNEEMIFGSRVPIQQRFTLISMPSRLVYSAPLPASVELATLADLRYDDRQRMNIYSIRPQKVLEVGSSYLVTSLMSNANAPQLQTAGIQYPKWIIDTQLYIPPSVTGRTLDLAQQIVSEANATTPYDRVRAVEQWLRANITYNENIPTPPFGQDPVDWVLFDHRQGYCNYYASSMVVMLRGLGIPARMAAGFAMGEWDGQKYIVKEKDAHTWVEVYFPGYGWVEFEPTSARAELPTPTVAPSLLEVPSPSAIPLATATPTNTPTHTPSPTATPTLNPPQDEALALATLSPTPASFAMTATIAVPPTLTPQEVPNEAESSRWVEAFFQVFLILFGLVMLVFILLGAFLVVWWWLEWRNLGGYSAVSQAYARMERYLTRLLGIHFRQTETPKEHQKRVTRILPKQAERSLGAIFSLYQAERYGNKRHPNWEHQSQEAWKALRELILWRWLRDRLPLAKLWWKD